LTIVLLSGGLDSTALLAYIKARPKIYGKDVRALSFHYGVRQDRELTAAKKITALLKVPHSVFNLSDLTALLPGCSLTDSSVPVPPGADSKLTGRINCVPNRNMILISIATAWAVSLKFKMVAFGAWDTKRRTIYPDRRKGFIRSAEQTMQLGNYHKVKLAIPFDTFSKADIIRESMKNDAPLGLSWSCYDNKKQQCGKCFPCIDRKKAFKIAGVTDPTAYLE